MCRSDSYSSVDCIKEFSLNEIENHNICITKKRNINEIRRMEQRLAIIRIMNRRTIFIRMKSVHKTAANDNVQSLKPALYNLLMWIIYLKGCDIRKLC